jgi:hypothetical protein
MHPSSDKRRHPASRLFQSGQFLQRRFYRFIILDLTQVWFTSAGKVDASISKADDLQAASLISLLGERGAVSSLINVDEMANFH